MITLRTSESEVFILRKENVVKTHVTISDMNLLKKCSIHDECSVAQVVRDAINCYLRKRGLKQ